MHESCTNRIAIPQDDMEPHGKDTTSTWHPLHHTVFRALWLATFVSNIGTWMHEVGGAWLMTMLAPTSFMVALVQVATSLPMVLLALPAGTLADVVDRRRLLLVTQSWMCLTTACFGVLVGLDVITPQLLLALICTMGLGVALNAPARRTITPEIVPRNDLSAAVALEATSVNIARALGPALGGLIMATMGPVTLFLLNAASFLGVIVVLYSWRPHVRARRLPAEDFWAAMQAGIRYVRHAPAVRAVLVRAGTVTLCGSAFLALLPLMARSELGQGAAGYGGMMGCFGIGAAAGTIVLSRLRQHWSSERIVAGATLVLAVVLLIVAVVRLFGVICVVMVGGGAAWLILLSTLNASRQAAVPAWVRGRALAMYVLVFFGGMAGGSSLWGTVATFSGIPLTLVGAAGGLLLVLVLTRHYPLATSEEYDVTPSEHWQMPNDHHQVDPEQGPVLVTVAYRVAPPQVQAFVQAMHALGLQRRRNGAIRWGIFSDVTEPDRYLESFVVESWGEHLRQYERLTVADQEIEEQVRSFHSGDTPPLVSHFIAT
jgi:MFS family permease